MATIAPQPVTPENARKGRARRSTEPFGGGIPLALLAIAVTGIGFWRTFFTRLPETDLPHMLHGASSTGWLVLVLVQAALIRSGKFRWHRLLGWSSLALFTLLIATSLYMLALMLSGKTGVPLAFAKLFAFSDITALPLLVFCYGAAIVLRKDRHVHSRLISVTLLAGLLPAAARMFNRVWEGPEGLIFAMHPTYLLVLAALGIAIFADWKNGRLRWPFPFAFGWFAVSYAILFPGMMSPWFDQLARSIGALV